MTAFLLGHGFGHRVGEILVTWPDRASSQDQLIAAGSRIIALSLHEIGACHLENKSKTSCLQ